MHSGQEMDQAYTKASEAHNVQKRPIQSVLAALEDEARRQNAMLKDHKAELHSSVVSHTSNH